MAGYALGNSGIWHRTIMSNMSKQSPLRAEISALLSNIASVEFKPAFILISVAAIQVISYYCTSRRFFRAHMSSLFADRGDATFWSYIYWLNSEFLSQFLLPILLIALVLREQPRDYGVQTGDCRAGLKIFAIFLIVMMPIVWLVSGTSDFAMTYPQCPMVRESWRLFALFSMSYIVYMIGWEFIWRGYMLFGLKTKFGYYAILMQMIPFTILHNGKPMLETSSAIIGGIALGILAWRTNSVWYCILTHASVMTSINLVATLRYRADAYGIGVNAIAKIFKYSLNR